MRPTRFVPLVSLSVMALAVPAARAMADTTRPLRLEYAPAGAFAVENLAGTMRVSAGPSDKVVVVATVHAEDQATADKVRLEQVPGESGIPTLRVVYPLDTYAAFRYPGTSGVEQHWLASLFGFGDSTTTKYAGRRVTVKSGSGLLLYADVEIQVPPRGVEATFRNLIGALLGEGVEGKLRFDAATGDITLSRLKGSITADNGSGEVNASDLDGAYTCNAGSGDCNLSRFSGESVKCTVGSGEVRVSDGVSRLVAASTGSGDVAVKDVEVEEFRGDTGSGDIVLEARGARLAAVTANTGSGDVIVRLDPGASFEARSTQASGGIVSRFSDAEPILQDKKVVGYRRGDGRTRIKVETGSGDITIEPGS